MTTGKQIPWAQEQRIQWIVETAAIFGFINRAHVMKKFRVSTPQASHDFALVMQMHPGTLHYDKQAKHYVAMEGK